MQILKESLLDENLPIQKINKKIHKISTEMKKQSLLRIK